MDNINKIGLYNCVLLCFIVTGTKRRIIFLFDTTSSPKRATISKRTFELLSIFSSLFFPPSIFHSILYRCTDWNGTKSNQARKGGDFLFFNRISVNRLHIGKDPINLKKNHTHRRRSIVIPVRSIRYESIIR